MRLRYKLTWTQTSCRFFTVSGCFAERSLGLFLFPPQQTHRILQEVLEEILEERVVSSRGRSNERAVKRKMSNYPIALRGRLPSQINKSFTSVKVRIVYRAHGADLTEQYCT